MALRDEPGYRYALRMAAHATYVIRHCHQTAVAVMMAGLTLPVKGNPHHYTLTDAGRAEWRRVQDEEAHDGQ